MQKQGSRKWYGLSHSHIPNTQRLDKQNLKLSNHKAVRGRVVIEGGVGV